MDDTYLTQASLEENEKLFAGIKTSVNKKSITPLFTIIEEGWCSGSMPSETLYRVKDVGYNYISLRHIVQQYAELDKRYSVKSK